MTPKAATPPPADAKTVAEDPTLADLYARIEELDGRILTLGIRSDEAAKLAVKLDGLILTAILLGLFTAGRA